MSKNETIGRLLRGEFSLDEIKHQEAVLVFDKLIKDAVVRGHKRCKKLWLPLDMTPLLWALASCMANAVEAYNETTRGEPIDRDYVEALIASVFDASFLGSDAALLAQWDHGQSGVN